MITDILKLTTPPTFTVDNTVLSIDVDNLLNNPLPFQNWTGNTRFAQKDNVIIESIWLRLPYCFTIAEDDTRVQLAWRNAAATVAIIPIDGTNGKLYIPEPDQELGLNIFAPFAPVDPTTWAEIALGAFHCEVSQVGVPDDLNDEVLNVDLYLKVRHTLVLS